MSPVPVLILIWFWKIVKSQGGLDVSTCGKSKGCWFMPPDCTYDSRAGTNCTTVVTWKMDELYVALEFDAQIDGLTTSPFSGRYVAVAFSKDGFMGDDSVVECVAKPDGTIGSYVSFNDEKSNFRLVEASVFLTKNTSGEVVNGRLVCRTNRLLHHEQTTGIPAYDNFKIFDLRKNSYVLQIARGRTKVGEGYELGIHSTNDGPLFPWMTKDYVKMSDNVVVSSMKQTSIPRSVQYNMVKVHGIFMVFGWWVFGSFAILLSRFAKHSWPNVKLCGTAVWFQLHRAFMVASVMLQVVAFILVFVQAWSFKTCSYSCNTEYYNLKLHTILGIICTVAAVIQPLLAMLRPMPSSPKRPIFNWFHWLIGTASWIIACKLSIIFVSMILLLGSLINQYTYFIFYGYSVTIFLSPSLGKSGLRRNFGYQPDAVMIGYLISFIVASILLEILSAYYYVEADNQGKKATMMLNRPSSYKPSSKELSVNKNFQSLQTSILVAFSGFAVCLCITLAYMIAMNRLL